MTHKNPKILLCIFISIFLFLLLSLTTNPYFFSGKQIPKLQPIEFELRLKPNHHHNSLSVSTDYHPFNIRRLRSYSVVDHSVLLPDYEVLVIISSGNENQIVSDSGDQFSCLFQNNLTSPVKFAGTLPFSKRKTFKCILPIELRRRSRIGSPILVKTKSPGTWPEYVTASPVIFQWNSLSYESLSTEEDVILFVKGVNNHSGFNLSPSKLNCVFYNGVNNNSVITSVTSSSQEVFRCRHPNETSIRRLLSNGHEKIIRVSIQVENGENSTKWQVPSVAYYAPLKRNIESKEEKKLLCACTMVYNASKFMKEWIMYHSKLGIEKFILYDNGSEDELENVVEKLLEDSYDVERLFWPWAKTQEAGFSHCAIHARDSCKWMMYVDVDEFVFSPKWKNSSHPSRNMLKSLLPRTRNLSSRGDNMTGQVWINCLEYGPSNQKTHPVQGVTQGYTCRRRLQQRHKSIVLLEAIDTSLLNVIHHFQLKDGYKVMKKSKEEAIVNHYKYQAWSEFKVKFRRRVSAYVVDWKQKMNPTSNDRTPGLGFEAIEPKGWVNQFCEVHDNRLKMVTQKWFGLESSSKGLKMAWQDD